MIAKITFVVLVITILNGCASVVRPNNINGKYYMVGDSNCAKYSIESENIINCFTENDEFTEKRRALTNQELQVYLHNQQMERQAWDSLMNNLRLINLQQQTYNY